MTFSNPFGDDRRSQSAYVQALLALLGERDPFDVHAELIGWLERRLRGVPDAALRRPEAPGKWSAIEVVQHLADAEIVSGFRTRMMLGQDDPPITGYDQDAWARRMRYADADPAIAMAQLGALRTANLRLWRSLHSAQLARVGQHSERGPESVGQLLRLIAAHDLVHRRQLERILAAA